MEPRHPARPRRAPLFVNQWRTILRSSDQWRTTAQYQFPSGRKGEYLDHGIPEINNTAADRAMRAVAPGRKNHLFVGSQTGGKSAATAATLIETAKLNGVAPLPDHKINRIDDLLP